MKKGKTKEENKQKQFPFVKDSKFVCSDGTEYTDGFYAREHEKRLSLQNECTAAIND